MEQIKVAIIGCGYWGKNLVRNFANLGALGAVCDGNVELAKKMQTHYNVPILTFDEILANPELKGVVIAAPAAQHSTLASKALKAGKHVYVEKPLALQLEDAQLLCKLAVQHNRLLMVGHLLQYHPAYIKLKELVRTGKLGKLQYIYSNRLNLGKVRTEENALWSFAPHDISMILGLLEEMPDTVYTAGASYLNPSIADVTTTHLSFKSGAQAHVFVSWLHPFKEQKLVVVGSQGMAVFHDNLDWEHKLQLYPHQVKWENGVPSPEQAEHYSIPIETAEPLKLECQHFLDCIATNTQPRTDGEEGVRVLQVLEAAEKSLNSRQTISITNQSTEYFKHSSAFIDEGCQIGFGTKIWHFSHLLKDTIVGANTVIGQNVTIGPDVTVGNNCKIQNNVSLYKGVTLEDGVFCGPSCVFTNVFTPRAEIERKNEFLPTLVERGTTIGANATIICGLRLGAYSLIGAGAVVTKDVKPHAIMVGNPARQIGWVSHAGEKLGPDLVCPREKRTYIITEDNMLIEVQKNANDKKND